MQMPETDLLGDPIPEPLPEGKRFNDVSELIGHTILAVFDSPSGRRRCEMVIVTATRCWVALDAQTDGCGEDSAYINVLCERHYGREKEVLHDFVPAWELLQAGCISQTDYHYLKGIEDKREQDAKAARAASLRAEADRLEGKQPAARVAVTPEDMTPATTPAGA